MKKLVVANWKMNPQSLAEAKRLFNSVKNDIKNIKNACPVGPAPNLGAGSFGVEVVICPPFVYLPKLVEFLSRWRKSQLNLVLGAQNCFWEERGPFTGEISPSMLKDLGCQYVIIGHSERRRYLSETDEMINKKIKSAIQAGLKPILCIGETENERKRGQTFEILKKQLQEGLKGLENCKLKIENLILAYEPVWAIGTGNPCSVKEAMSALTMIRKIIANLFSLSISSKIRILYGGSVNKENCVDYIKKAKMNGLLVGGASLDAKEFVKIIKAIS